MLKENTHPFSCCVCLVLAGPDTTDTLQSVFLWSFLSNLRASLTVHVLSSLKQHLYVDGTWQIRAANLSGDCQWKRELNRGNFNIQGQHQVFFFTLDLLTLTSLLLQDE